MTQSSNIPGQALAQELNWWFNGSLLRPVRSIGSTTIAAAGPWIVAVLALGIISLTMEPAMGIAAVEDMRLTVVYAFCLAPLVANPVAVVASRRIANFIESGTPDLIPGIYFVACAGSGLLSLALAVGLSLWVDLAPLGVTAGFVFLTSAAALLWTSFAVLSALRDMGFLIRGFSIGMVISVVCIFYFAQSSPTTELLIWCFIAGCLFCVALTARQVLGLGAMGYASIFPAAGVVLKDIRINRHLCIGVLLATAAVWIDKWMYWFSPEGVRSQAGFLHYPVYDSVMFLAHLSIIPSLAAMLLFHDGDLTRTIKHLRADLGNNSCFQKVLAAETTLINTAWGRITSIVFLQATIAAGCILITPFLTDLQKFSFDQFLMFRIGLIAVFLYTIFNLACALLIICNQVRTYALLQGGFLVTNLGLSVAFYLEQGTTAYPFFISSLAMASIATVAAYRAVGRYLYLTMLGANDALYQ